MEIADEYSAKKRVVDAFGCRWVVEAEESRIWRQFLSLSAFTCSQALLGGKTVLFR